MNLNARALLPVVAAGLLGSVLTLGADRLTGWRAGAQDLPTVVQAQRFELLDATGAVRGVFGVGPAGPGLTLADPSGQARVVLDETAEGTYEIQIRDAGGAVRFGVGTTAREGGFVGLNVRDATGAIRSRMYASDDGQQAAFQVQDPGAVLRVEMGLNGREDRVGVGVRDARGATVWQTP
jgi:hypothetical protein